MGAKLTLASLIFASISAYAVPASADVAKGRELAQQNCARCHNIEPGGAFKQRPPSFAAIAKYRTREDIWGRIIAPPPHANMPELVWTLTPDDVQHLLDFIVSLETP
jgi:mono/diheme cytochrome c family protein